MADLHRGNSSAGTSWPQIERLGGMPSQRSATITVEQQPNGYWQASITATIPGRFTPEPFTNQADGFHNAGEAIDWARSMLELAVRE